jgi:GntR family transcriptional repressor for pyruvate dehydrogenase complex
MAERKRKIAVDESYGLLSPVKRTSITDDIFERLLKMASGNGLAPGDKLPSERKLQEMLGVSRLPLREALARLAALGIIEVRHGSGAYVRNVDHSDLFEKLSPILKARSDIAVNHIIEVREVVEEAMAAEAAKRCPKEISDRLKDEIEEMKHNLNEKEMFIRHDMAFHQLLALASGNPIWSVLVGLCRELLGKVQYAVPDNIKARRRALQYHREICRSVIEGDSKVAAKNARTHIRDIERYIHDDSKPESSRKKGG